MLIINTKSLSILVSSFRFGDPKHESTQNVIGAVVATENLNDKINTNGKVQCVYNLVCV